MNIVSRIYSDLFRSGLLLWRDDYSASYKNYPEEIKTAINKSKGVILFDSLNSRTSKYVQEEGKFISEDAGFRSNAKQIAICLIGNLKETHSSGEIIKDQNSYRFFDFSQTHLNTLYDNDRTYFLGISELCKFWNTQFVSLYPASVQKDFEDELSRFPLKNIDRDILLKEFDLIQIRLSQRFYGTTNRLLSFYKECEALKINCPSLTLQLAIEFIKDGSNRNANEILRNYTADYPDDPRGWRLLGNVLFDLNDFQEALVAYEKAILSAMKTENASQEKNTIIRFKLERNIHFLLLVKLNHAATLLKLNKYSAASQAYNKVIEDESLQTHFLPENFLVISDAFDSMDMKSAQLHIIAKGLAKFPGDYELNLAMGRLLCVMGKLADAVTHFEIILKREVFDLEVYSEYLSILKSLGKTNRLNIEASSLFSDFPPTTSKDLFYFGYIHYLIGDFMKAKKYYNQSKYSELPWYDKMWTN